MLAAMPHPPTATEGPPGDARAGHGDACPGALRTHRADDGELARVRLPAGVLTAAQAETLGEAAERFGDGVLHLTSRGNVQLRGLPPDGGRLLAGPLSDVGLLPSAEHERVRNIAASPLSGLDGRGGADVLPWTAELDALLCNSRAARELSGRFLFAFDDGRGDVLALEPDVALVALGDGTAALSTGARRTLLVPSGEAAGAALSAALRFLELAAAQGPVAGRERAWRVAELPDGPERLLEGLREQGLGRVSPAAPPQPVPGGPAPGAHPGALAVALPLGQLGVGQWRLLLRTAREAGSGELRLTPWRGVVLPGVQRGSAGPLADAGLVTAPDSAWPLVSACTGLPGCAKAHRDVRGDAAAAVEGTAQGAAARAAERAADHAGLPVHWSGCSRRCGRPRGRRVDVLAEPDGYRVAVRE
nr:hypothetical protein [Streptomyces xiaopingdaonensis]